MKIYEKGFMFEVVKNGLYGIINRIYYDQIAKSKMYSVSYYETDGRHYMTTSVFPETIESNLRLGIYKERR